jgi:lysophospholipase L1-like esterase
MAAYLAAASLAVVLLFEILLRLAFGYPHGWMLFAVPGPNGLYPPNATIEMTWGPIAYTVRSNALGMRGGPVAAVKPEGSARIAAIGDSMTDGFFVDNEATYPSRLEARLRAAGVEAEVLNAARGKFSVGEELAVLREIVAPLDPNIALLTFVTNDIADLRGRTRESILDADIRREGLGARLARFVVTRTAIGEFAGDAFYRLRYPHARPKREASGEARYAIEGGEDFARNVEAFEALVAEDDGRVLGDAFDAETESAIADYVAALEAARALCEREGIALVFIYCPAYSQIYDASAPMLIRDRLAEACASASIPFLDLTAPLRRAGRETPIHLAPVDYHFNPRGNDAVAEVVAEFLFETGLIDRP